MKRNIKNSIILLIFTMIFTGCEQVDNFIGKTGKQCNSKDVVLLAENILNSQIIKNGNLKIDSENIVVWNYNKVGRYDCKAKISGTLAIDSKESWLLSIYGLQVNQKTRKVTGWIDYNTYITTKGSYYYVSIKKISK